MKLPVVMLTFPLLCTLTACSEQPPAKAEEKPQSSLGATVDKAVDASKEAMDSAKEGTANIASDVKTKAGEMIDSSKQATSDAMDSAKNMATDAVDSAKGMASDAADSVKGAASNVMDKASEMGSDAMDKASGMGSDAMDKAAEMGNDAKQKATDAMDDAKQKASELMDNQAAAKPQAHTVDGAALAASKGCVACHSTSAAKMIGPGWGGLAGSTRNFTDGTSAVADDDYLRVAIINPNAQIVEGFAPTMPAMPLQDEEVDALVSYIKTLN